MYSVPHFVSFGPPYTLATAGIKHNTTVLYRMLTPSLLSARVCTSFYARPLPLLLCLVPPLSLWTTQSLEQQHPQLSFLMIQTLPGGFVMLSLL